MGNKNKQAGLQTLLNTPIQGGSYLSTNDPGTSKYDRAGVLDLENNRGEAQGALDSSANILGRFLGRATLSVAETAGMFTWGVGKALANQKFSDFYDNEVTQYLDKINKEIIQTNTPFYQTNAEKQSGTFSGTNLTSTRFWGNVLGEGGGFVAGALVTGGIFGAVAKSAQGIGLVSKTAKALGMAGDKLDDVGKIVKAASDGTLPKLLNSLLKGNKIKNAALYQTQVLTGNMYEAGVEARGIKESILADKIKEYKATHEGAAPSSDVIAGFEDIANTYANVGFGMNLVLLNLEGTGTRKFFKGFKESKRTINTLRNGEQYVEKGLKGKILDRLNTATGGGRTEMFQEGGQYWTEKYLSDVSKTKGEVKDHYMSGIKALSETFGSKDGQESMIAGLLLGSPSGIKAAISEGALDKHGINYVNKFLASPTLGPIFQNTNSEILKGTGDNLEKYATLSSPYLFHTEKDASYFNYVNSRIQSGRYGDILDDLDIQQNTDVTEFNKVWGTEYTEDKKQQVIKALKKQAENIKKVTDDIESSYSEHPNKEALIKYLSFSNNVENRIKEVQNKLMSETNPLMKENLSKDLILLLQDKQDIDNNLAASLVFKPTKKDNDKGKTGTINSTGEQVVQEGKIDGTLKVNSPTGHKDVEEEDFDDGEINQVNLYNKRISNDPTPLEEVGVTKDTPDKSFVQDVNNPDSAFVQATDIGIQNFSNVQRTGSKEFLERTKGTLPTLADNERQLVNDILDRKIDFKTIKFSTKQTEQGPQIYADVNGTSIHAGYLLDLDKRAANNSPDTFATFLTNYAKTHPNKAELINKLLTASRLLNSQETENLDITPITRLDILEKGQPRTKLSEVLNSPRFQINGQLVIGKVSTKGVYTTITGTSPENEELFDKEIASGKYDNNLGSQYVLMVQRPNNGPYIFLNLSGESIQKDSEAYSRILEAINGTADVNYNPNNDVFLATDYAPTIKTKKGNLEIPVHISFKKRKDGKWVIYMEPKYYGKEGITKDINGNVVNLEDLNLSPKSFHKYLKGEFTFKVPSILPS